MAKKDNSTDLVQGFEKHVLRIEDCYSSLKYCHSTENQIQELEELYRYIKTITANNVPYREFVQAYHYLNDKITRCESLLPSEFIIDSNPDYEFNCEKKEFPKDGNKEEILDYIVYMTRRYLNLKNSYNKSNPRNFNSFDLVNECNKASRKVKEICSQYGINSHIIVIHPGFTNDVKLYNGSVYHYITIVNLDGESFIVDTTYRQFFTLQNNILERIGIPGLSGCKPGVFVTMDKERLLLAEQILKKGWFKFTNENLKIYLDAFAISYRNGLYYETTGDYSYTTSYTADDYKNFLLGIDNQVNHEGEENLGFQRTLTPKNK